MSMNPGATTQPVASSSSSPRRFGPISVMTAPVIATSVRTPGAPLPSTTVPPRMTMSAIAHELQEIPVGIAYVHAACFLPTTALARNGTFDDFCTGPVEPRLQRFAACLPHEAQIAARRCRRRRAQIEAALPQVGPVEV